MNSEQFRVGRSLTPLRKRAVALEIFVPSRAGPVRRHTEREVDGAWRRPASPARLCYNKKVMKSHSNFPIKLRRPLIVFDIESTGTSPRADRIIELAAVRLNPNGSRDEKTWLINPERKIPVETIAIHGITDAEVADCPYFRDVALDILTFFADCDLAGFSAGFFDIPILNEEFLRCGITDFRPETRALVDAQKIYHKFEPRNLSAAMRFYCNREIEEIGLAHSAMTDTKATIEVLIGELNRYPESELPHDIDALDKMFNAKDPFNVDRAGRWRWSEGEVVVNFGKKKGEKLRDLVANKDGQSFLKWMIKGDFPPDTRDVAEKALAGIFPAHPPKAPTL